MGRAEDRAAKRALGRAGATVQLAANDPILVARELAASRDQVKAAFIIVRALLGLLGGGPITIPAAEFTRPSDLRSLHSQVNPDGSATVQLVDGKT